jgi:hypothetical protein
MKKSKRDSYVQGLSNLQIEDSIKNTRQALEDTKNQFEPHEIEYSTAFFEGYLEELLEERAARIGK